VGSYARLLPYLWPHRRALIVSTLFGCLVAIFWGANLSVAFPLVKVLLEGKDLHTYVEDEIARYESESESRSKSHAKAEEEISLLIQEPEAHASPRLAEALALKVRLERKQNEADAGAWQMRWVQHYLLPWIPRDRFETFSLIMGLLVVATVLKGICIFIQDIIVGRVVQLVVLSVRKEMLRRTLFLDYPALADHGVPHLMSRFTFDTEQMAMGINMISGRLVREPLKCLACLTGALYINWRLTVMSMLFAPVIGLFFYRYGCAVKRASRRMTESMSRLYRILEETFEGTKVVIAFGRFSKHRTDFHREYKEYLAKSLRLVWVDSVAKPTTELLVMGAVFIAMLPAAYLALHNTDSIGGIRLANTPVDMAQIAVLYAMLAGMLDPFRKVSNTYSRIRRSAVSLERVFELIDQKPKIHDPAEPLPLGPVTKSVEFRDVCFAYPSRTAQTHRGSVLKHLSLKISAGEVVAIVGHNGCGKSTLVNLLPRYYDIDSGDVRLDGTSVRDVRLADLRRQIGVVTQDTILFDGTIAENIAYGDPQATPEEIQSAADRAYVTAFLDTLPNGIHSRIGEKGKDLSGGQRQRVALARAIVRNPSILILDEATSAADNESAALIHQALQEFARSRTVLMITHSMTPSLLEFVTRVVVLDDGQVLADGTHEEVARTCSVYRRLFHATEETRAAA
jgi:subfamily B ATP-binding cassette protein MsbA